MRNFRVRYSADNLFRLESNDRCRQWEKEQIGLTREKTKEEQNRELHFSACYVINEHTIIIRLSYYCTAFCGDDDDGRRSFETGYREEAEETFF